MGIIRKGSHPPMETIVVPTKGCNNPVARERGTFARHRSSTCQIPTSNVVGSVPLFEINEKHEARDGQLMSELLHPSSIAKGNCCKAKISIMIVSGCERKEAHEKSAHRTKNCYQPSQVDFDTALRSRSNRCWRVSHANTCRLLALYTGKFAPKELPHDDAP
jgi:hypothetical protein